MMWLCIIFQEMPIHINLMLYSSCFYLAHGMCYHCQENGFLGQTNTHVESGYHRLSEALCVDD